MTPKHSCETFIDGIGSISFVGGVIRADLVKIVPDEKDKDKTSLESVQRLIITPQGFLQSANVINDLVNKLTEAGVIQQKKVEGDEKGKGKGK